MVSLSTDTPSLPWGDTPHSSAEVVVSIRRNTLLAIVFSILLHLAALITLRPQLLNPGNERPVADTPFTVNLAPPKQAKAQAATAAAPEPVPAPAATPPVHHQTIAPPRPHTPKPIETPSPIAEPTPPVPTPAPTLPPDAPQATDMASYIAAMKARKEAAARAASGYAPDAPTGEDARSAAIARNLQSGTSGLFEIQAMDSHSARFLFRNWTSGFSNVHNQTVEVQAGPDGNVQRAIVRRVIALIREHYSGDFNWESHRLGRTIVLSARIEDSAGLEDFLLKEFPEFNTDTRPSARPLPDQDGDRPQRRR
jgi:hypothetical protein